MTFPRPRPEEGTSASVRHLVAIAVVVFAFLFPAIVFGEPTYPEFSAPVVDAAHVLTDDDKAAITRKLVDLQKKTGVQFAVATVPSLGGAEIEPYANALFRKWKIGQKGVDNGLLLILAPKERKLRFEVGYGLEGSFTDVQSKLILHNTMVPRLKADDPAGALMAGVDDAAAVLTKDKADLPQRLQPTSDDLDTATLVIIALVILFFVLIVIFSVVRASGRRGGASSWAAGSAAGSASSGLSDDRRSSGSSGDSGFSGGGGGDSGGGGASDSY